MNIEQGYFYFQLNIKFFSRELSSKLYAFFSALFINVFSSRCFWQEYSLCSIS